MSELPRAERELLAGAERRVGRFVLLLVPVGTAVTAWQWGGAAAAAFALGGVLAYLNYRWIVAVVDTLVRARKAEVPRRSYLKLFLPVVLLVVILYVIFSGSWLSPVGVLAGLFLLAVGIFLEGIYEILLSVRG
jgi:small-conductance mechanosensitive channel